MKVEQKMSKISDTANCMTIEDFEVGDTFEKVYQVTYEMVRKFSEISGDWNPVHHDKDYARKTVFKQQIAQGMISVAQFSGIFGMDMPGLGTIWVQQEVTFLAPVYLERPYTAAVEVIEIDLAGNTVTFSTICKDQQGKIVLSGKGVLKPIPKKVKAKLNL